MAWARGLLKTKPWQIDTFLQEIRTINVIREEDGPSFENGDQLPVNN